MPETFYGYQMDSIGRYPAKVTINSMEELSKFLLANIETVHELLVTDKDDMTVMHCKERVLLFPIPKHGSINNYWCSLEKKFVEN